MNLVLINPATKDKINEIIEYSKKNIIFVTKDMLDGPKNAGNDPNHVLMVPVGVKCVYSHKMQIGVMLRHFSMSVDIENRYPHPISVDMMLEVFGFRNRVKSNKIIIWQDDDNQAINCLETLNESDDSKIFKHNDKVSLGYN